MGPGSPTLSIIPAPLRLISGTVLSKDLCMKDGITFLYNFFILNIF